MQELVKVSEFSDCLESILEFFAVRSIAPQGGFSCEAVLLICRNKSSDEFQIFDFNDKSLL
ncbi:hypothetical protein C9426_03390 [Serratia sp. S1B]|nr:hypothetical protein C9426_03390 [Serratia sp. S1B]